MLILVFLTAGCNLDTSDPAQARATSQSAGSDPPPPAASGEPTSPFLRRSPTVSSLQVQPPQGRDPQMEQGARFMVVVNEYKQRLSENPNDREALYFLGNANFDINRFGVARDYYERYLDLDPDNPSVRTDLASTHYRTQNVEAAIRELNTVLERTPDHPAALFNLGSILVAEGRDPQKAIALWERLLEKHPDYRDAENIRLQIEDIKKNS